jgi:selenocysteine lyase/cysteine desulfurase
MTPRTKIISLSHVQYSNGFRAPLEEIGERKGEHLFVVNASQSAGALGIDVRRMRIDALCATGHKWMLAGYGSGFVYLSRKLLERTRARAVGWLSMEEPYSMRNSELRPRREMGARAELGCPPFAGIFALGASVDYMLRLGTGQIEGRVLALNRYLTARLRDVGREVLSPLFEEGMRSAETLVASASPAPLVQHLAARGVAVTEKPQGIRVSTHFFNNEHEIERLIDALEEAGRLGL